MHALVPRGLQVTKKVLYEIAIYSSSSKCLCVCDDPLPSKSIYIVSCVCDDPLPIHVIYYLCTYFVAYLGQPTHGNRTPSVRSLWGQTGLARSDIVLI